MSFADIKRRDQLGMLEQCRYFADTGVWNGLFTYPGCPNDLFRSGLADAEGRITIAGRAALFLASRSEDFEAPHGMKHPEGFGPIEETAKDA